MKHLTPENAVQRLKTAATNAQRQAAFRARHKGSGMVLVQIWVPKDRAVEVKRSILAALTST